MEKTRDLKSLGAEWLVPAAAKHARPTITRNRQTHRQETQNSFYPDQYIIANPARLTPDRTEIWQDKDGKITHFVSGIARRHFSGTGAPEGKNPDNVHRRDPDGSIFKITRRGRCGSDGRISSSTGNPAVGNADMKAIDEIINTRPRMFDYAAAFPRQGIFCGGSPARLRRRAESGNGFSETV